MAFLQVGLLVASLALKFLVRQRVKRTDAPDLELPKVEEGVPIPLVYGTQALSPIFNAIGDIKEVPGPEDTITFYESIATGDLCLGELKEIVDIQVGTKSLRLHPMTRSDSTSDTNKKYAVTIQGGAEDEPGLPYTFGVEDVIEFDINARQLFGGQLKEGGVERHIRIHKGTLSQAADEVTTKLWQAAKLPGTGPGYPGCAYIAFGKTDTRFYWGTVAQPKTPVILIRVIPTALGFGAIGGNANPAEIIYDLLTHPFRGRGISPDLIDIDSFIECGRVLVEEQLGLSMTINSQRELQDIIEDIGRHIHGDCYQSALTGKWTMVLARDDYDAAELDEVNRSRASDLKVTWPSWRRTTNEVKVVYRQYDETPYTGQTTTETYTTFLFQVGGVSLSNPVPGYTPRLYGRYQTKGKNINNVTVFNTTRGIFLAENVHYRVYAKSGLIQFGFDTPLPITGVLENGDVLQVAYTNGSEAVGFKESTETAQDLANQQATQEVRSETLQRPFFTTQQDANVHAKRELKLRSRVLADASWSEDRTANGYARKPNDVVAMTWEPEDGEAEDFRLTRVPFRVVKVDYGENPASPVKIEAIMDVFGATVMPTAPSGDGGGGEPGVVRGTSPAMAIGCGLGGANVRIALFASDVNFDIKLWVADDATGLNRALVDTFTGDTLYYDTATTGKYYQAQLVRNDWADGPLTDWITCVPEGTTETPSCVEPTYVVTIDELTGRVTITETDEQHRTRTVEFRTRSGDAVFSEWVVATATDGAYTVTVTLSEDAVSRTEWRATYQDCVGDDVLFEGGHDFVVETQPPPAEDPTGLNSAVFEIPLHADAVLAMGMIEVPAVATAATAARSTEDQVPLEQVKGARITASILATNLPVGAYLAIQFEAAGSPGTWNYLDTNDGPKLALDQASLELLDTAPGTAGPWVVAGGWTLVTDVAQEDVRIRAVVFGGDGSAVKSIIITRLAVQFREQAGNVPEQETPNEGEPTPNPGSCTEAAPLDGGLNNYANEAALDAAWAETNSSPAENVWTVSPGIIVLSMSGGGTGPVERERLFAGFTPSELVTFYLLVTVSNAAVEAFFEAEGTTTVSATATVTTGEILTVQVIADADGEVTLRWGVNDSSAGVEGVSDDDLDYVDQAAAEANSWVVTPGIGTITFDTGVAVDAFPTSVGIRVFDTAGTEPYIEKTYTVISGSLYTIKAWAKLTGAWWHPASMSIVSGANSTSENVNGGEEKHWNRSITADGTSLTIRFTNPRISLFGDSPTLYVAGLDITGAGATVTAQFGNLGFCEGSGIGTDEPDPDVPPVVAPTGDRMFGNWRIPVGGISYWTAGLLNLDDHNKVDDLYAAAKAAGCRHFVYPAGYGRRWIDSAGNFQYSLWKYWIDYIYNHPVAGPAFLAAIADGTFPIHMIIDEPDHPTRWGPAGVPYATVERMCLYSKQLWPDLVTCLRVAPQYKWFTNQNRHMNGCDLLWAEYTKKRGDPAAYRDRNIAGAQLYGHGCVIGIHYIGFDANYALPDDQETAITAAELRYYGKILGASSFWYAMMGWCYQPRLFNDPEFHTALGEVRDLFASYDP